MSNMRFRRFFDPAIGYLLSLCGLLAALPAHPVVTYEPEAGYWYVEMVTLDESELPSEFHIYTGESSPEQFGEGVWLTTNNPEANPRSTIYLINRLKEPIYVLSLEYRDRLVMATPDENYAARVRMAHEVASYLVRPDSGEVFELNWEALMDLDASLTDPNPPTFEPLSADATPPAAQHSELLLVVGEQVVLLPFTVSYAVNQNFKINEHVGPAGIPEPTSALPGDHAPNAGQWIALALVGLGLAGAIAWLAWRWRKRH
jgi:hypothetical protein